MDPCVLRIQYQSIVASDVKLQQENILSVNATSVSSCYLDKLLKQKLNNSCENCNKYTIKMVWN